MNVTPIIANPDERADRDFRRTNDNENVVRVKDRKPDGFSSRPISRSSDTSRGYITVAGTQRTQDALTSFIDGSQRQLELERDPLNAFDANAIKVIGEWTDAAGNAQCAQLGWVPRDIAKRIHDDYRDLALAATIECMYRRTPTSNSGLRIDIWTEKQD